MYIRPGKAGMVGTKVNSDLCHDESKGDIDIGPVDFGENMRRAEQECDFTCKSRKSAKMIMILRLMAVYCRYIFIRHLDLY